MPPQIIKLNIWEPKLKKGLPNFFLKIFHNLFTSENDDIKTEVGKLTDDREQLMDAIDAKEKDLRDAVQSFTYLSDAAEAKNWINEKMKAADADTIGSGMLKMLIY